LPRPYPNWEMVVSDNFSDDGEWEFFEEVALRDGRILIAQAPRRGLYQNWNKLRRASARQVCLYRDQR
jgi:glycosyltransferase involved in cell wall biosynthesis